jgi:superfamily II DNA or RNA helicase
MHLKNIISSVNSWFDFKEVLNSKTKLEKGNAFEELTKYYLSYNPIYKSKLKTVWLQKEVPASILKKLNLPLNDQGIDLIAETNEGEFWAIQCKYLQDEDQRLSHRNISTFISLSTGVAENITYCLVCTTVDEYAELYKGKNNIGFCNSEEWNKLDKQFFDWLRNKLKGKDKLFLPYSPKPHQKRALEEAKKYFVEDKSNKGKLVFPCGAGKSLTGYWITKELNSKSIIVAVPSLSLVKQTLEVYLRETAANKENIEWLCVCSDEGIGRNDDIAIHIQDIGIPCVTDKKVIVDWLLKNKNKKTIIFTTYQSGKTIAEAAQTANFKFDLGILDEAHKTVGAKDKLFSYLLFDKNISIAKRIFMTATERRYAGSSDTILSMDDLEMYGETFATISFKEAIETGILSDYKIITLFISDEEVKQVIEKNAFVKPVGKEWDKETEARTLASLIALRKAMNEYPIHHAVTFHSSIAKSKSFEESQAVFSQAYSNFSKVDSFHVSGAMPTAIRSKIVNEFANSDKAIITNAKCLTEGVDVPNIDCVLFADPRKSTIDIVQAVGRALRKKEGKEYGYVILPVFTKSKSAEAIIESEEFQEVLSVLRALASNDERIIEYFRDISKGKKANKNNSPITFEIDEKLANLIDEKELINSIQLTTWNKLAKLSWMPFEEAREFVRDLNLKSILEWNKFYKSNKRPNDIPTIPQIIYKNNGWINFPDFLGNNNSANQKREFLDFEQARKFIQSLKFKNVKEYRDWSKSGKKPTNIPGHPSRVYNGKGYISWDDWLGTKIGFNGEYLRFEEAKNFIKSLKIKNTNDWKVYCKSNKKPNNIPNNPRGVYKNNGWISMADFLSVNEGYVRGNYLSFKVARTYVRKLKLKLRRDWIQYCKSGNKPKNIPSEPDLIYKENGFVSFQDWLGSNYKSNFKKEFLPFNDARDYVRTLKIKSESEWRKFVKSPKKPSNIPAAPPHSYKNEGWNGWADFLGKEE